MKGSFKNIVPKITISCPDNPLKVYLILSSLNEDQHVLFPAYPGIGNDHIHKFPVFHDLFRDGGVLRFP